MNATASARVGMRVDTIADTEELVPVWVFDPALFVSVDAAVLLLVVEDMM